MKGDVTEHYKTNMTVTVKGRCKETYGSHHTEVDGHREESCLFQTTKVKGALTESHASQQTTVQGPYILKCETHDLTVGAAGTHTYGTLGMTIGTTGLIHDDTSMTVNTLMVNVIAPAQCEVQSQTHDDVHSVLFEFDMKMLVVSIAKWSSNNVAVTLALSKIDFAMIGFSFAGLKLDFAGVKMKNKALDDKSKGQLKNFPIKGLTLTLKAAQVEN